VMVQEAGIPESQAMFISGHKTRAMPERYKIVSLKNVQDAGAKLHKHGANMASPSHRFPRHDDFASAKQIPDLWKTFASLFTTGQKRSPLFRVGCFV